MTLCVARMLVHAACLVTVGGLGGQLDYSGHCRAVDGRMWVHYNSGLDAPLEPAADEGPLTALG